VTVARTTLSPCLINTEPPAFWAKRPVSNSKSCPCILRVIVCSEMLIYSWSSTRGSDGICAIIGGGVRCELLSPKTQSGYQRPVPVYVFCIQVA